VEQDGFQLLRALLVRLRFPGCRVWSHRSRLEEDDFKMYCDVSSRKTRKFPKYTHMHTTLRWIDYSSKVDLTS